MCPSVVPFRDIRLQNLSEAHSRKNVMILFRLSIYGFLLSFSNNIGPNSAPLRDIRLQDLSDPDFNILRSLKVKSEDAIGLPINYFL